MIKSKLRNLFTVLLSIIFLAAPKLGAAADFDRHNFMSDPYLPFLAYDSKNTMLEDFQERFGKAYELVNDDTLAKQVQAMVDEVYNGYKKLYPKFMSTKAKPGFVIAKSDDGMDLTTYQPRKHFDAHKGLMIFTTGFLNLKAAKAVKLGLVAHEMSHLLLWHLDANIIPIRTFYKDGGAITLNESESFKSWLLMSDVLGWANNEEMNGVTIDSQIGNGLSKIVLQLFNINNTQCGSDLAKKIDTLATRIQHDGQDRLAWDYPLNSVAEKKQRSEDTNTIVNLINACLATQSPATNKISLSHYVKNVLKYNGVKHPFLTGPQANLEMSFDQYIDLVKTSQAKMREISQNFDYSRLRYYSAEDQSDEISITVLKALGYDGRIYAKTFLDYLEPEIQKQCKAIVDSGAEPPLGNFKDIHHAPCWRYYNLTRFANSHQSRLSGLQ